MIEFSFALIASYLFGRINKSSKLAVFFLAACMLGYTGGKTIQKITKSETVVVDAVSIGETIDVYPTLESFAPFVESVIEDVLFLESKDCILSNNNTITVLTEVLVRDPEIKANSPPFGCYNTS